MALSRGGRTGPAWGGAAGERRQSASRATRRGAPSVQRAELAREARAHSGLGWGALCVCRCVVGTIEVTAIMSRVVDCGA